MLLSELAPHTPALVAAVEDVLPGDLIGQRLRELGFVPGETVKVVAAGPLGGDPILVQIGYTRFALRRREAARVHLQAPLSSGVSA